MSAQDQVTQTITATSAATPSTTQQHPSFPNIHPVVLNHNIEIPTAKRALEEFMVWNKLVTSHTSIQQEFVRIQSMLRFNHVENVPVNQLSEIHADLFMRRTRDKLPRARTVKKDCQALKKFFGWLNAMGYHPRAVDRLIKVNFREMTYAQMKRPAPKKLATDEDIERLIWWSETQWKWGPWFRFAVIWALEGGLRLGDCAMLQWDCIDLKERLISTFTRKSHYLIRVAITDRMLSVLPSKQHEEDIYVWPEVALRYKNEPLKWAHSVYKFMKSSKAGFGFHSLRHTYASRKAAMGIDVKQIARCMGHRKWWTTRRYVHELDHEYCI